MPVPLVGRLASFRNRSDLLECFKLVLRKRFNGHESPELAREVFGRVNSCDS